MKAMLETGQSFAAFPHVPAAPFASPSPPAPRPGPCDQRKGAKSGCEPTVRKQPDLAPKGEGLWWLRTDTSLAYGLMLVLRYSAYLGS